MPPLQAWTAVRSRAAEGCEQEPECGLSDTAKTQDSIVVCSAEWGPALKGRKMQNNFLQIQRDAFQDWRRERDAVEDGIKLLLASRQASAADRRIRQPQLLALLERRNAAARKLLATGRHNRRPQSNCEWRDLTLKLLKTAARSANDVAAPG